MNRELGYVMSGIDAAGFAPDFLAMTIEIVEHIGADGDVIELLQQAEAGEFADSMWQRIDTAAEFADRGRLLEHFAADAAGPQHQRHGEAANSGPNDNCLHRPAPRRTLAQPPRTSHGRLLGRKRLCRLSLQLGPGLRLSLNFQILEILTIAYAVAENLLFARQILRRTEYGIGTIPRRRLQRERRVDQMRAPERHKIGAARRENGIDLIWCRDVADTHGCDARLIANLLGERRLEHSAKNGLGVAHGLA